MGTEMLKRFSFWHDKDTIEVWNILCILADEYPLPSEEALEFLKTRAEKVAESNILNFLSKTRPGSKLLRNYCLNSFYANQNGPKLPQDDVSTAAKLLGIQFRKSEEILLVLSLKYKEMSFDSKLVIALCEGWPTCKKLDDMYNYYLKNKPKIDYETYFYLISVKSPSDFVYDAILRAIHHIDSEHIGPLYSIIPPVLHRLKSDDTLVKKLIEHLKNNPTSSEKVIMPRMISDAVGISQEFKAWCQEELQRQFNITDAFEIGIDLGSGKPKAVIHTLLEVLSQPDRSNL